MTDNASVAEMRRIRPWIAALLTFLGWGVGFYYARRTRMALLWAFAPVVVSLILGAAVLAYMLNFTHAPSVVGDVQPWMLDVANLGLTAIVAALAWRAAAKQREVVRASPVRLLGYLAIWLVPFALVLVPMSVRFFYMQPFRIPAGSMEPALHVGDFVLVSKSSYGYGPYSTAPLIGLIQRNENESRAPARGDIAIFRPTSEPERDFVKRVVGLPGDRIQMINGVLHINASPVQLEALGSTEVSSYDGATQIVQAYRETLPNGVSYTILDAGVTELDNTREYIVPPDHYFMMGDHRDNSADSRIFVGMVPIDSFVGRVDHIVRPSNDGN
jgi:signal peptidase I